MSVASSLLWITCGDFFMSTQRSTAHIRFTKDGLFTILKSSVFVDVLIFGLFFSMYLAGTPDAVSAAAAS